MTHSVPSYMTSSSTKRKTVLPISLLQMSCGGDYRLKCARYWKLVFVRTLSIGSWSQQLSAFNYGLHWLFCKCKRSQFVCMYEYGHACGLPMILPVWGSLCERWGSWRGKCQPPLAELRPDQDDLAWHGSPPTPPPNTHSPRLHQPKTAWIIKT